MCVSGSTARWLSAAFVPLMVGSTISAQAQSALACRLIGKSDELHLPAMAADLSGGYLRLLLIYQQDDVPSRALDFAPFSDHRSVYGESGGDNEKPEFWMATVESDGQILIDRWEIYGPGVVHTYIKLQCPSHGQ